MKPPFTLYYTTSKTKWCITDEEYGYYTPEPFCISTFPEITWSKRLLTAEEVLVTLGTFSTEDECLALMAQYPELLV